MALRELFEEEVFPKVQDIFGGDVSLAFGKAEARRHDRPPLIVVYPQSGAIGASRNNGRNPTQMFTRQVSCMAEMWGEHHDQVEQLFNNFAEAMQIAAVTSWQPTDEAWDESGDAQTGVRLAVRFRVDVPLIRTARKTAHVNDWQTIPGAINKDV